MLGLEFCANAQELTVGDTLPDYRFTSVLRYDEPALSLSDTRGKILILDLWRTTCNHAVASFAQFDSLQHEFGSAITTVAITTESRKMISDYLTNNTYARQTRMPVITDDTVLAGKRFSFLYIPHVVVVNQKGVIVAVTQTENVTREAIRQLLAGADPKLPLKKELTDYNYSAPLLLEGKGRNVNEVVYSSTFTHYLPGVVKMQTLDTTDSYLSYNSYNASIAELYMYSYHRFYDNNRIITEGIARNRVVEPKGADLNWRTENLWCSSTLLPKQTTDVAERVAQEWNRFFGMSVSFEKRKMKCLVLVRKGKGERWKSGHPDAEGYVIDSGHVTLVHNTGFAFAVDGWKYASRLPIIDKTGLGWEMADMKIEGSPNELAAFRKQLQQYDLDLVPSIQTVDVLVIKKGNDSHLPTK